MTRIAIVGLSLVIGELIAHSSAAQSTGTPAQRATSQSPTKVAPPDSGLRDSALPESAPPESEELFVRIQSVKGNQITISEIKTAAGRGGQSSAGGASSTGGAARARPSDTEQTGDRPRGMGSGGGRQTNAADGAPTKGTSGSAGSASGGTASGGIGSGGAASGGALAPGRDRSGSSEEKSSDRDQRQGQSPNQGPNQSQDQPATPSDRRGAARNNPQADNAPQVAGRRRGGGGAGRTNQAREELVVSINIPADAKVTTATRERRTARLLPGAELAGGLSHPIFAVMERSLEARIVQRAGKVVEVNVIVSAADVNSDGADASGAERPLAVRPKRPGSTSDRTK